MPQTPDWQAGAIRMERQAREAIEVVLQDELRPLSGAAIERCTQALARTEYGRQRLCDECGDLIDSIVEHVDAPAKLGESFMSFAEKLLRPDAERMALEWSDRQDAEEAFENGRRIVQIDPADPWERVLV